MVIGVTRAHGERLESLLKGFGTTYPIMTDADDTFEALGVKVVPENLLIDRDRKIVAEGLGDIEKFLETTTRREDAT